jgi:DnaK suppressor protein
MAATSRKKAKKLIAQKSANKKVAGGKTAKKMAKKTTNKSTVSKKTVGKTTRVTTKKTAKRTSAKKVSKKTTKKTPAAEAVPLKKAVARKKVPVKKAPANKKPVSLSKMASGSGELIHGISRYKARSRESYMNLKQLDHFRHILSTWRRELVDEINRTIHSMQDETVNHPDPNDRATQESDMSLELRSRDRERKLIKKIDGTISLIDSGDYGYCDKCGVEVGIARLEARPTANLCVDCKTLDEIREKQMI